MSAALKELIAKGFGRGETPVADLVNAVQMVRGGSAGMAFGWPGIVDQTADAPSTFGVQFALPPTASEEFSGAQLVWQKQTLPEPVAYLGVAGRLMGVGRRTRNAVSAFHFCTWLSATNRIAEVNSRSRATLWFRASQAQARRAGTGGADARPDGEESVKAVERALSSESPFIVPRIPGIDEYLIALADAVRSAARGEATPATALKQAVDKFEEITKARRSRGAIEGVSAAFGPGGRRIALIPCERTARAAT